MAVVPCLSNEVNKTISVKESHKMSSDENCRGYRRWVKGQTNFFCRKNEDFFVEISKSNLKELFARNFYSLEIILCAHSVFFWVVKKSNH